MTAATIASVPARRGTTNRNDRGNTIDRLRRRVWLVDTFGDGEEVKCHFCPEILTVDTVTADRIIPGCDGGRYVRGNIRPSCLPCASKTGGQLGVERKRARRTNGRAAG